MKSQPKSRPQRLLLVGFVALALLLLLLRLFVFMNGHGPHRFHSAGSRPIAAMHTVHAASNGNSINWAARPWTDRFDDGTPDFLRLTDPADQAAFRQWFTQIADFQAVRPKPEVPAEITDCASLLRYAYREALKRHDDTWFMQTGTEVAALPGEIRAWRYPETPLGAGLFRVRPGNFESADTTNGSFAQFADAKTLVERNAYFVTRDARQAEPGDLLFYRQFGQSSRTLAVRQRSSTTREKTMEQPVSCAASRYLNCLTTRSRSGVRLPATPISWASIDGIFCEELYELAQVAAVVFVVDRCCLRCAAASLCQGCAPLFLPLDHAHVFSRRERKSAAVFAQCSGLGISRL